MEAPITSDRRPPPAAKGPPLSKDRLFIVDAFAHIFRAYYAIRNLDNNAVFGFTAMLRKLIQTEQPEYLAVAFDSPGPTFRSEIYPEYKANRQEAPEDLKAQIPIVKEVCDVLNIPLIEYPRYEADDVIGTLAKRAAEQGMQAVIVSGDKDLLQLVQGDDIVLYDDKKGVHYLGEEGVLDFFGCRAEQVIDLLTIWGDASDNIPGVKGVGEKGAKKLLAQYGTIEAIYEHLDEVKRKSYREGFEAARDHLDLSRKLVTIHTDLDIPFEPDALKRKDPDQEKTRELFSRLGFKTMLDQMDLPLKKVETEYPAVTDAKTLQSWVDRAKKAGFVVFDVETSSLDPHEAALVGVALALGKNDACYVPLRHTVQPEEWALEAEALLAPLFADKDVVKCAHNAKFDLSILLARGFEIGGLYEDTMLMSYLIQANENRHGLDHLAETRLDYETIHFEDVCGSGKDQITFDQVELLKAAQYAAEDADVCCQLHELLRPELEENELVSVYNEIELPLIPVLARMELTGVRVDEAYLGEMSQMMRERIDELVKQIYELAGEEFNINSPKQLGEIMFDKLGLPPQGKTGKTKNYSTSHDVLEKLAALGHELPAKLLLYREVTKLHSTYVDALPGMINAHTGRVHSSFNQFVTATGRLSSGSPNLQNIPIKSEMGREIRGAFLPKEGWVMLGADYSQVELRLMAHFSEDKTLVQAFRDGEDIHRRTAAEIMDVMPDLVDDSMRRTAKSINFGLIYGMRAFRLSQELGITRKQAQSYIDRYFEKMPGVPRFWDEVVERARAAGEIRTHFGRRRLLPELKSRNKSMQAQGERLAVNTLIQGTAAEMIKLAMIRLDAALREQELQARIILQVHDELILECPPEEAERVGDLLKTCMEEVVDFRVPFLVEVHQGKNWKEVK